ncbi:MAG: sensor domain-containing diguanylate cyclase [Desulfuromonadaceae bacterium]|nr:sensor domain-containing diguanylate cyclase [Desulfuromonadaceae bacterium]
MKIEASHLRQTLDVVSEAVYLVDRERRIVYWNNAAELLTGYTADEVVGQLCEQGPLQHVDSKNYPLCEEYCPLKACIDSGASQEKLVFFTHKNGHKVPILVKSSAVRDEAGAIVGAAEVFSEALSLVDLKEVDGTLRKEAQLDTITGILNERTFQDALEREWFRFKRYKNPFALLRLELDFFKIYVQIYGRVAGEKLLNWLVTRLRSSIRQADIVGRVGADGFVVILPYSNRKSTLKVANMVLERVRREMYDDLPFAMTVSIGAVIAEDSDNLDHLLEQLASALQRSKEQGRNQVTFWG